MAGSGAAFTRASGALSKIQSLSTSLASRTSGSDGASSIASSDTVGGALWTTMAGFVTALLGGHVTHSLPTRTQALSNPVPAAITTIATSGFASTGDGGGATYVRAAGPFADGTSFQSADGAWWQFQPNGTINAQSFGVIADGFSFANGTISASTPTKLVLPTSGWPASAIAIGNPITVIGGASGGGSLITTISAISGNTITLSAPVAGAMTSVCGNFGTDNTTAINRVIAYATSLVQPSAAKTFQATDVQVFWPFGLTCFAGVITIPDYVSIRGWGSRGTQWLAMAATAQVHMVTSGYAPAGGSYGQNFYGWSIHGNNITTSATGLVHADTIVGASFNDFRVWWSLGDGLYMDNAQNCQFNNCSFADNGNPSASFYIFTVAGITISPAAGAVYTNNSQSFQVLSSAIVAGAGTVVCVGSGKCTASGTLVNNNGGTGDSSVNFSAFSGGGTTGTNIRFTNAAAGSVFIRCETQNSANWGVVFEGDTEQNVLLLGELEGFKGQYSTEYYPISFPNNSIIAQVLCDGGAGATPYEYRDNVCSYHEVSSSGDAQGRAIPSLLLRNGGRHIVDTVAYVGDNLSGTSNAVFCMFGPSPVNSEVNTLICQGSCFVDGNKTLFYDAHPTAGSANSQVFGHFSGNYAADYNPGLTGQAVDNIVTTPANFTVNLNSGHIQFPPSQIPSADPHNLDDYNEFFFTPAIAIGGVSSGIGYSFGPYANGVKVGQMVSGCGNLTISSIAALTGAITITGLPFAATGNESCVGLVLFPVLNGVALGSGNQLIGYMAPGSTAITINLSGASGTSAATHAILSLPTTMEFAFEYQAAV